MIVEYINSRKLKVEVKPAAFNLSGISWINFHKLSQLSFSKQENYLIKA